MMLANGMKDSKKMDLSAHLKCNLLKYVKLNYFYSGIAAGIFGFLAFASV